MKITRRLTALSSPLDEWRWLRLGCTVLMGAALLASCGSSSGDSDSGSTGGTNPDGPFPPIADDDSASVQPGQSVLINVLANDFVFEGALNPGSVTIGTPPGMGTATVDSQGRILYEANLAVQGEDIFTYTVAATNGLVSDEATVSVQIDAGGGNISFQSVEILEATSIGFASWGFAAAAALEGVSYDAAAMYLQDDGAGSNLSIRAVGASGALGPLNQYELDFIPSSGQIHAFSVADGGALFMVGDTYFHLGSEGVILATGNMPEGTEWGDSACTFMSCGQVMIVKGYAPAGEPLAFTFEPATSAFVSYLNGPQGGFWYPEATAMLPATSTSFFTFHDQNAAEPTTRVQEWTLSGLPIGGEIVLPIKIDDSSISTQEDGSFSMTYAPGTYARRVTHSPSQWLTVEEVDPIGDSFWQEYHAHAGSGGPSVSVDSFYDPIGDQWSLETRWQSAPGLPYYYSTISPSPFLVYVEPVCDEAAGAWLVSYVSQIGVLTGGVAHWNETALAWDIGSPPVDPLSTEVYWATVPARDGKILIFSERLPQAFGGSGEYQYLVTVASPN